MDCSALSVIEYDYTDQTDSPGSNDPSTRKEQGTTEAVPCSSFFAFSLPTAIKTYNDMFPCDSGSLGKGSVLILL